MGERAGDPGTHVPFAAGKGIFDRFEAGGPSLHLGERTTEKQAEDQEDVNEGEGTPMIPIMRFASCFTIQHNSIPSFIVPNTIESYMCPTSWCKKTSSR